MNTNWADKTAESFRRAKDIEKLDQERFLKERGMVLAQVSRLWKSLYATIQANVSRLTEVEPYLKYLPTNPEESEFTVTSWRGRDHIVVRLDTVPSIQYAIYRRERPTPEEPNFKDTLTFEVQNEQVWLMTPEAVNLTSDEAAHHLLDMLVSTDDNF
ncbi:MAG: hypothetical protein ACMG6H_15640 [Acidobacteriota bacterium]